MFAIHCTHCQRRYLVGPHSIVGFDNTVGGPVASVRCPHDHLVRHTFRTGRTDALVSGHRRAA